MEGGPELEFDLYDCNIDNVVAYNPGSMFATQFWPVEELTPTAEMQMTEFLFPPDGGRGTSASNGPREDTMLQSRTSDLTASVTSAELRNFGSGNNNNGSNNNSPPAVPMSTSDDGDEEVSRETDRLLAAATKAPAILNLTHIDDDDISFADEHEAEENVVGTHA